MNRRDLLKQFAAVPVAAAVAPPAIADDGVALNSMAHPYGEGEDLEYNLSPDSLEEVELELPEHEWNDYGRCMHCGVPRHAAEDGLIVQACQFTRTPMPW